MMVCLTICAACLHHPPVFAEDHDKVELYVDLEDNRVTVQLDSPLNFFLPCFGSSFFRFRWKFCDIKFDHPYSTAVCIG